MYPADPTSRSLLAAESRNLDLMRGIAVLLVFVGHVLETWGEITGSDFHPLDWHLGRIGVLLFFVHTALVLTASLARSRGVGNTTRFYVRRVARIYPLSMVAVLLMVGLQVPTVPWRTYSSVTAETLLANLTLTMDLFAEPAVLAPLWTLPIEVQIYALLPIMYWFMGKETISWSRFLILYGLCVALAGAQAVLDTRYLTLGFLPCFGAGILAFALRDSRPLFAAPLAWPVALMLLVAGYLVISSAVLTDVHNLPFQWMFCLVLGLLIPRFCDAPAGWWSTLWHLVAKYSYGVYLFHCMVLYSLVHLPGKLPFWAFTALAVVGTAIVSVIAYHLIEAPMIRLGARISRRIAAPDQARMSAGY